MQKILFRYCRFHISYAAFQVKTIESEGWLFTKEIHKTSSRKGRTLIDS